MSLCLLTLQEAESDMKTLASVKVPEDKSLTSPKPKKKKAASPKSLARRRRRLRRPTPKKLDFSAVKETTNTKRETCNEDDSEDSLYAQAMKGSQDSDSEDEDLFSGQFARNADSRKRTHSAQVQSEKKRGKHKTPDPEQDMPELLRESTDEEDEGKAPDLKGASPSETGDGGDGDKDLSTCLDSDLLAAIPGNLSTLLVCIR